MAQLTNEEIDAMMRDGVTAILSGFKRWMATGYLPGGVKISRPPEVTLVSSPSDHWDHNARKVSALRVIAEEVLGKPGAVWDYEIIIRNFTDISINMDYVGNRDTNVLDITTSRVWTGARA